MEHQDVPQNNHDEGQVNNNIKQDNQTKQAEEQQTGAEEISALKSQLDALQDKLYRTLAEADNTRKRLEKSIEDTREYAIVSFAKDLLGVSDNLSRALDHRPQDAPEEVTNIIAGVEMTKHELDRVFQKYNLTEIAPQIGEKFNSNLHHAIAHIENNEFDQDSIIAIMQCGYKMKERLLRPAIVQVSKKSA